MPNSTSPQPSMLSTVSESQPSDSGEGCECATVALYYGDETDGWLSVFFLDTVKGVVTRLLSIVLYCYLEETCYGCNVDHPSQKHHACLWGIPDDFFRDNFGEVRKRLWTDRFIPSIRLFLEANSLSPTDESKLRGVAETFLHELRFIPNIEDTLLQIQKVLTGEDETTPKNRSLEQVVNFWYGNDV
ncbi:zinc finger BED domain-containing protein 4-like [Clarias magur]|uniref:Zinc finger BED domain-containing protein 4-like n=1 Tax=Clarias magur TaxID=1594786 RepID=A0A8J4TTY7_CLAMG|nr:zinc finger BED domain-containing protein 4-like [Clarias magur]